MRLIQLLGRPTVLDDGVPVLGARGNKVWGLLAYLVGNGPRVSRDRLVPLLFADADDGLAALRWNLAQLRRIAGEADTFAGDPVVPGLGTGVRVDVDQLVSAPWYELVDDVRLDSPLLEGLAFPACAGFELWLEGERLRIAGLAAAALREAAHSESAAGRPMEAAAYARRLVALRPWEETGHEVLVRALAQAGDAAAARAHVLLVTRLFLDEFGVPPSRSLSAAALQVVTPPQQISRARTLAQLEAGAMATSAGAAEAGVDSLSRAVAGARGLDDSELLVRALTELGSAHVHAVRGTDESGVSALREAVAVSERVDRPELATAACRELAYVDFLQCRSSAAGHWLDRAMATVGDDESERAWILVVRGSLLSDAGRHSAAVLVLRQALDHADTAGDRRAASMALTHLGRLAVLREQHDEAIAFLERARRLAHESGWLSFLSYPTSWLAEVALGQGRLDDAGDLFGHAHALALEVGDPCWESLAARGLGLLAGARGDGATAARLLHQAPKACRRLSDTYVWIEGYALAAQAAHAVAAGSPQAIELIDQLDTLASAHGLREFQAEASLLRMETGLPGAVDAAQGHVAAVDNPVLAARLGRLMQG